MGFISVMNDWNRVMGYWNPDRHSEVIEADAQMPYGVKPMSEALDIILSGIKNAQDEDGGELWHPASWATREGAAYEIAISVMKAFGESDYLLMPITEIERFRLVREFLRAYATGDALTFVDPQTGKLVSTTSEARALADACLKGPGAE